MADYYDYDYSHYYNYNDNVSSYSYDNNSTSSYSEVMAAHRRYQTLLVTLVLPACLLGLAANAVSVWAWNANKGFNAMVQLFQILGLADNVFLLLAALHAVLEWRELWTLRSERFLFPLLYLSQSLSVYVTLGLGVLGWLGVARPQQSSASKRHVLVTCGALVAWCLLLTTLVIIRENALDYHGVQHVSLVVLCQVLGFVLPTLLLLCFSLALLALTWRHRRRQQQSRKNKTKTKNENENKNEQPKPHHSNKKTTISSKGRVILAMAVSSFVAFPVAVTAHLVALVSAHASTRHVVNTGCGPSCVYHALGAGNVLQVLNSSVNFFFYLFFDSKFRVLLRQKVNRIFAVGGCPGLQIKASTTTISSTNSTPDSSTHGSAQHTRETTPSPAEVRLSSRKEDKLPSSSPATSADPPTSAEVTSFA